MTKLELLKSIEFGESVAELEADNLSKYFIETHHWQQINDDEVDIVYGTKGSGKSAIYSLIDQHEPAFFDKNIILKFAEKPRGTTIFSDLQTSPPASEQSFIYLWKLYLLSLIGEHFQDFGVQTADGRDVIKALTGSGFILEKNPLKVFLGVASNYIKKYFNPTSMEPSLSIGEGSGMVTGVGVKITFNEPSFDLAKTGAQSIDTLLHKANKELEKSGFSLWFLLDRLDVAFADNRTLEENALRALFKAYLDLADYDFIQLKIFLRSDIWQSITKDGFREATHIRRSTTIEWDRAGLLNLIVLRLVTNDSIREVYGVTEEALKMSQYEQQAFFYRVFPRQVDTGRNPDTLEWLISRVQDSMTISAPRDIINLINYALSKQIKIMELGGEAPDGELLFTRKALKDALSETSKEKVEKYLFAEHPSLRVYLEKLKGKKTTQTNATLSELWNMTENEAAQVADQIFRAGVWRIEGESPLKYWTKFIFRDGLGMIQGQAD